MLNVTVLMGRMVSDPELRHTSSDIAVTSFTIAVDKSYQKSGADRQADFIDIVAWRNTAEFVCKYFCKGQLIAIQGSIQTRSYQDKDGNKRKATEIVADNVHFADSKKDSGDVSRAQAANQRPDVGYTPGNTGDFEEIPTDDDLPF